MISAPQDETRSPWLGGNIMPSDSIIFDAHSVRATLAGLKTQTRRIMKPQPSVRPMDLGADGPYIPVLTFKKRKGSGRWLWPNAKEFIEAEAPHPVGSRLWVRETWATPEPDRSKPGRVAYDADGVCGYWIGREFVYHGRILEASGYSRCFPAGGSDTYGLGKYSDLRRGEYPSYRYRWRPAHTMPKWASRLTLEVTNVRVQRVQDITEEDAVAEGVLSPQQYPLLLGSSVWCKACQVYGFNEGITNGAASVWSCTECDTHVKRFRNLFNSINPGAWDRNDWVFAYTFKQVPHGQ
jgi:hypothetical protein